MGEYVRIGVPSGYLRIDGYSMYCEPENKKKPPIGSEPDEGRHACGRGFRLMLSTLLGQSPQACASRMKATSMKVFPVVTSSTQTGTMRP